MNRVFRGVAIAWVGASLLAPLAVAVHAAQWRRRGERLPNVVGLMQAVPTLPLSLVLAPDARHVRSLAWEDPTAAFSDAPAWIDVSLVGSMVAPPQAVWAEPP